MILALAAAAPAAAYQPPLTPDGWGKARIGMSRSQVEAAIGAKLEGEALDDEYSCIDMKPVGEDQGIWFMFEEYKLSRISVGEPSKVTTPRGIGIGASADEVRAAYGSKLQIQPHYYEDLPSEYLTYWTQPKKRGVRFETDSKRRVQSIHAGGPSIEYVEGCA
jgi:hypothetical protein